MKSEKYDLIILDEVLQFINAKPLTSELVLTGRYCPPEIIEVSDLVTIIDEKKHYFSKGVKSRQGIKV